MRGSRTAMLVLLFLFAAGLAAGCGSGGDTAREPAVKDIKGPALLFFTNEG